MNHIGIDIAKATHVAAVVDGDGEVLCRPFGFSNDEAGFKRLADYLAGCGCESGGSLVAMESTGHYWLALWEHLSAAGWRIVLINPIQTDAFRKAETIRKTKTDSVDAVLIAQFARFRRLEASSLSAELVDGLRQITRYRSHLVEERSALKNRATALADRLFPEVAGFFGGGMGSASCRAALLEFGTPAALGKADVRRVERVLREASRGRFGREKAVELKALAKRSVGVTYASEAYAFELRRIIGLIGLLDDEVGALDAEAARMVEEIGADVLETIPGIGPVNAAVIAAEVGDPTRFADAKKLIAFAGLDASKVQSGAFEGAKATMSKRGSSYLRYALMMSADAARRCGPYFGDYYDSMISRGKHHYVALSGVARKLAGTILAVWRENRPYEPRPSIQSEKGSGD